MTNILKTTLNCTLVSIWTFLLIFGNVMDVGQIKNNDMSCGNPVETTFNHHYNEDCVTKYPYNITYKVINVIGGTIAIAHASYFVSNLTYTILKAIPLTNIIFLFKNKYKCMIGIPLTIGNSFLYEYIVYNTSLCSYNQQFCTHKPYNYETMKLVYTSLIVMGTIAFSIYAAFIGTFLAIFYKKRLKTWNDIKDYETALLVTRTIKDAFHHNTIQKSSCFQEFLKFWSQKSDQSIIDDIPIKSKNIIDEFLEKMDRNESKNISYNEFIQFAESNCIYNTEYLWSIFTQNKKYDVINQTCVEDLLYELFFARKQLSLLILSDLKILFYLILYLSYVLYPAGFIVICKIFGYENAFGNGIDLFKTYAVIISYVFSNMSDNIKFIGQMLFNRPYNIGDILKIDDDTFAVIDFDSTNTVLEGAAHLNISNRNLINNKFLNFSKAHISDSFDVTVPLNSLLNKNDLLESVNNYISRYEMDINPSSIRTGWVGGDSGGKTMRCNWRYKFNIMDRSRLNRTRTNIINFLYDACNNDIIRSYYSLQIANGGGLNDNKTILKHAEKEIHGNV